MKEEEEEEEYSGFDFPVKFMCFFLLITKLILINFSSDTKM